MDNRQKQHQLTHYKNLERDILKQLEAVREMIKVTETFPDELLAPFDSLAEQDTPVTEKTLRKVEELRSKEYSPDWSMTEKIWWLCDKYGAMFINDLAEKMLVHEPKPKMDKYEGKEGQEVLKRDLNYLVSKLKRERKIKSFKESGYRMKWGLS